MTVLEMVGSAIPQGMNTQVNIYLAPFEETIGIFTVRSSHCFIKAFLIDQVLRQSLYFVTIN